MSRIAWCESTTDLGELGNSEAENRSKLPRSGGHLAATLLWQAAAMPSSGSGPTRRGLLGFVGVSASAGLLVAGCRQGDHPQAAATPPPVDPRVARNRRLLTARIDTESQLIDAYQAALRSYPALAKQLAVPLAHHETHRNLLISELHGTTGLGDGHVHGEGSYVPVQPAHLPPPVVVANLAAMERTAARSARSACAVATGRAAGLLGSVGAAEATHADMLSAPVTG